MNIIQFFEGTKKISCTEEASNRILNILITKNMRYSELKKHEDGTVTLLLPSKEERRLHDACTERFPALDTYEILWEKSLKSSLKIRRKRIGLLIGILVCAAALYISSLFVWNIQILSPDEVNQEEIINLLADAGFHIGSYIPSCDFEKTALQVLIKTDSVSFLSINMKGTVAQVEVAARTNHDREEDETRASNLVAKYTGHIIRHELRAGQLVCRTGQVVEKGELLIAGIYESKNHGTIVERAKGSVYAMVEHRIITEYPLSCSEKRYTGKITEKKILSVFGNETALYRDDTVSFEHYEESVSKEKITLFSKLELPAYMITKTYREFVIENKTLTEEEAKALCEAEHAKKTEELLKGAETVEIKTEEGVSGGKYVIRSTALLICDITEEIFIEGTESSKEP